MLYEVITLEINGIRIIPFAVAENDALQPDNRAYLIEYEGIRVLHLGDCQADILDRERPETARRISQLPQNCDVVVITSYSIHYTKLYEVPVTGDR